MISSQSTRKWLAFVVVLQVLILLTLLGGGPAVSAARAEGIPDAGAQREEMIAELKATNAKLDRLVTLLGSGQIEVKLSKAADGGKVR